MLNIAGLSWFEAKLQARKATSREGRNTSVKVDAFDSDCYLRSSSDHFPPLRRGRLSDYPHILPLS